jgi:hypothetical protein
VCLCVAPQATDPAGNLTLVAQVSDRLGAAATATTQVAVSSLTGTSLASVKTNITTLLTNKLATLQVDNALQVRVEVLSTPSWAGDGRCKP